MNRSIRLLVMLLALFAWVGCDSDPEEPEAEESFGEEVGEDVDDAAEETGEAVDEAADETEEAADEAEDEIDEEF